MEKRRVGTPIDPLADATIVLAIATVILAGVTWNGTRRQQAQFNEAERNAALPFPVITGRYFIQDGLLTREGKPILHPGSLGAEQITKYHEEPATLHNLGRGPALYVQWELTAANPANTVFEHHETRPTHLAQEGVLYLWHPARLNQDTQLVHNDWRVTLWYDDTFGNHYQCIYRRQGDRWTEEPNSRRGIAERPGLPASESFM